MYTTFDNKNNKIKSIGNLNVINGLICIIVLVTIFFSKTCFFGIEHRSTFQWLFYLVVFIGVLLSNSLNKNLKYNLLKALIFVAMLIIQMVLSFLNNPLPDCFNTIIGISFSLFACACLASSISFESFSKYYINIMSIICVISLIGFMIALNNEDLAVKLSGDTMSNSINSNNIYVYSWFYTFGRYGHILKRNSGPFWEPGAFQGFIIISILLSYNLRNKNNKSNVLLKIQLILFLITLLTTQSTTGYILAIFILVVFFKQTTELYCKNEKYKIFYYSLVGAIFISIILYIIFSNNISDKFNNVYTDSADVRWNDISTSFQLLFSKGGLIGLGLTNVKSTIEFDNDMVSNSVGLLAMGYTYGILFFVAYCIALFKGIWRIFSAENTITKILIFIIFIVLHLTEDIWHLPIYLLFLFRFKSEREIKDEDSIVVY